MMEAVFQVAHATALKTTLDIRLLSFCDGHRGICQFSWILFEKGTSYPKKSKNWSEVVLTKSCSSYECSTRNQIFSAKNIAANIQSRWLLYWCALTVDEIPLRVYRKHFCDLRVQFNYCKRWCRSHGSCGKRFCKCWHAPFDETNSVWV